MRQQNPAFQTDLKFAFKFAARVGVARALPTEHQHEA